MNRDLLNKIDFVIHELNLSRSDDKIVAPSAHVVRELVPFLKQLDVTSDIEPTDWDAFLRLRDGLEAKMHVKGPAIDTWKRLDGLAPIISRALAAPGPLAESRFKWTGDPKLRDILDRDLEEAENSLKAGEWKSCMVLCGSILEAALYDYLRKDKGVWAMAQADVPKKGKKYGSQPRDIISNDREDGWTLGELVRFACAHGILEKDHEGLFSGAVKDTRDLIHPAAELRGVHRVEPETAATCLAALKQALKRISEAKGPPR